MAGGERPKIRKVQVIANPLSGSVGANAVAEVEAILADFPVEATVRACEAGRLQKIIAAALEAKPDLVIVIAGDGTARAVAEAAGPDGPMVAPLPGGTMNMLPGALYGGRDWPTALREIMETGEERMISGGTVEGHSFYVAAILGSPALWARAREAARMGRFWLAVARARRAARQAFSGRLRYTLDGAQRSKAEALTFMCPLVSKAIDNDTVGLEAAALDPAGALDVFRLAVAAAAGNWRRDAAVQVTLCRQAYAWAGGPIPAILDGESVRLGRTALVRFKPNAFRALVPSEAEA
ncbi:MAG TPA: diacylglycerol kinase family protein [Alphaproteobacteria bacterium]|nr:diacylglycerol kinase family protein [Alphaproteobacteria bacterium]